MEKVKDIVKKMSIKDKIRICCGENFWQSIQMDEYGIPSFFMSDGPHGLRTQKGESDHLGINQSEESTCFPTASASASSWNPDLLKAMGEAIGEEALHYDVDVVLGPGVCMKRNPLCGRNFEYFSEDPYLAGVMGINWVDGVQSKGVGTSVKHFAANNQEQDRMMGDSLVDERTLREIYLPAFEMVVKNSRPDTVMCSYNKVNGIFSSDNKKLLTDILRTEWGYEGMVVTDWGAMNDRIAATKAGCDLEMPGSKGFFDEIMEQGINNGLVTEAELDLCVGRILRMAFKAKKIHDNQTKDGKFEVEKNHELARRIAEESAVLLKNEEQMLPLAKSDEIALCGSMAKQVRYQGAGSSHINPTKLSNVKEAMEKMGKISYYPAYEIDGSRNKEELEKAVSGAACADKVIVVVGLPDSYESEGYDRTHMKMPDSHCELIREIAKVNSNIIVVLMGGSPVEMPWIKDAKAILNLYLGGQAVGEAAANLLFGEANPSGKLAETYPISYQDCSSSDTFGINPRQVEYAEGLYVGYRYYEKADIPVQFPFGFGLSYTQFVLSELMVEGENMDLTVSCIVKNTGHIAGAQVVQLYVADQTPNIYKAVRELKGFVKVYLEAGEEKQVSIPLNSRSFAHYDVNSYNWEVLTGTYQIEVGTSCEDICMNQSIKIQGTVDSMCDQVLPEWYRSPKGKPSVSDFEKLYGSEIKPYELEKTGEFTLLNTFHDMESNPVVAQIAAGAKSGILKQFGGDESNQEYIFTINIVMNTPLVRLVLQSGGSTPLALMEACVGAANGNEEAMTMLGQMMSQMG